MESKKYLMPTPGGSYYFVQDSEKTEHREVIRRLVNYSSSLELSEKNLMEIFNVKSSESLKDKLKEFENLKLIQVVDNQFHVQVGNIEEDLVNIIKFFSKNGKALLSDSQGFCVANNGFPSEMSDEISVLSADIAMMHKRRALGINSRLGLNSQAWSIVDASGNSRLGFWPLNIEDEVFVLAVEGVPSFNRPEFVELVWMLYLRYGK